MKKIKTGGLLLAVTALSLCAGQAAQTSNAVGYDKVPVLGNSDAIVSAPFDNGAGTKTLNQMLPGSLAGLAYIASTSPTAGGRKTEVLVPDFASTLVNKSPVATYYYYNGAWRKQGAAATIDFGSSNLVTSAQYVILRNKNNGSALSYLTGGGVAEGDLTTSIATAAVKNDLYISAGRAVGLTLNELQLGGTTAFVSSTSPTAGGRKDELLRYDNAATGQNKSPAETYYYYNGGWRKQGASATLDFGSSNIVEAASGLLLRKAAGAAGAVDWTSLPTY